VCRAPLDRWTQVAARLLSSCHQAAKMRTALPGIVDGAGQTGIYSSGQILITSADRHLLMQVTSRSAPMWGSK